MKFTGVYRLPLSALLCSVIATYLVLSIPVDAFAGAVNRSCSAAIKDKSTTREAKGKGKASHGISFINHPHSGHTSATSRVGSSSGSDSGPFSWTSYWFFGASFTSSSKTGGTTSQSATATASVIVSGSGSCAHTVSK